MILVVGATGLVGSAVCEQLSRQGESVRALVRHSSSPETLDRLRSYGVDLHPGDLKDPASLAAACHGVEAVISTASCTLSRQPGDSIQTVDRDGQLSLVHAAQNAHIDRFLFVSFRPPADPFPLSEAKQEVEAALAPLNSTIIQASWFMEVWLSPALGFDYANRTARIYGDGTAPVSWVSSYDVATMCAKALRNPAAERATIAFGGPQPLSPLEVVSRFEQIGGRRFTVEHLPEAALRTQFQQAADPMQKSFAGLMLAYANGDAIDMKPVIETFAIQPSTVEEYARRVLLNAAAV